MGCVGSAEVLNSKAIDKAIKEEAKRTQYEVKLLLLGTLVILTARSWRLRKIYVT